MIAWETVENAIQKAVTDSSQLAPWEDDNGNENASVIWIGQGGPFPNADAYITLSLVDRRGIGRDGKRVIEPTPGDVRVELGGMRRIVVRVVCYASEAAGEEAPGAIVERIRSRIYLPSNLRTLKLAGVGLGMIEPTSGLDGSAAAAADLEPRAEMRMVFHLGSTVDEPTDWFNKVVVEHDDGSTDTVDKDFVGQS